MNNLVKLSGTIAEWGEFKIDTLDLNLLGSLRQEAVKIFENQIEINKNFCTILLYY